MQPGYVFPLASAALMLYQLVRYPPFLPHTHTHTQLRWF